MARAKAASRAASFLRQLNDPQAVKVACAIATLIMLGECVLLAGIIYKIPCAFALEGGPRWRPAGHARAGCASAGIKPVGTDRAHHPHPAAL